MYLKKNMVHEEKNMVHQESIGKNGKQLRSERIALSKLMILNWKIMTKIFWNWALKLSLIWPIWQILRGRRERLEEHHHMMIMKVICCPSIFSLLIGQQKARTHKWPINGKFDQWRSGLGPVLHCKLGPCNEKRYFLSPTFHRKILLSL